MRNIFKSLIAASFLVGCGVFDASAADIPRPVYKGAPSKVVAYYNWTGFYIGGNAGYSWGSGDGTFSFGGAPGTFSGSGSGWLGGFQAGYNVQFNSFVFGIEADYQWSGASGTVSGAAGGTTFTGTGKTPNFATVRGRLGYAYDRTLFYFTGGVIFGKSTLDGTVSTTGAFSSSVNNRAWTIGGGVEYAFLGNWSGKIEYLYTGKPNDIPVPPGVTSVDGNSSGHIVRVGVNYRFSGPIFSRF